MHLIIIFAHSATSSFDFRSGFCDKLVCLRNVYRVYFILCCIFGVEFGFCKLFRFPLWILNFRSNCFYVIIFISFFFGLYVLYMRFKEYFFFIVTFFYLLPLASPTSCEVGSCSRHSVSWTSIYLRVLKSLSPPHQHADSSPHSSLCD